MNTNNINMGYFQADVDGNGTIDYIEFITATMHLNRMEREDHLYKAFEYFDKDKSGLASLSTISVSCCIAISTMLYVSIGTGNSQNGFDQSVSASCQMHICKSLFIITDSDPTCLF